MPYPVLAFLATLILGPGMFLLFAHVIYRSSKEMKFPEWWGDGLGDFLWIPLFNALAFGFSILAIPVAIGPGIIAALGGVMVGAAFSYYRLNAKHNDWSRPKKGRYNAGGWYHLACMVVEFAFVIYALMHLGHMVLLWLPLLAYLTGIGLQIRWRLSSA